jgi:hypothetical protein
MLSFQPYFTGVTDVWAQSSCKLVQLKTLTEGAMLAAVLVVAASLWVTVFCQVLQVTDLPSWLLCTDTLIISSWKPHFHIMVLRSRLSMLKFSSP